MVEDSSMCAYPSCVASVVTHARTCSRIDIVCSSVHIKPSMYLWMCSFFICH